MASNELELIIKAVDNASDVISKVSSEVQGMASEVDSAVENVDADKLANEFKEVDSSIDGIDSDNIDKVATSSEKATGSIQDIIEYCNKADSELDEMANDAQRVSQNLGNMNAGGLTKIGNEVKQSQSRFQQLKNTVTSTFNSGRASISNFLNPLSSIRGRLSNLSGGWDSLKASVKSANKENQNASVGLGFLKNAASMTVGMIGFDLVNSFVEAGRSAINARGQLDYFAGRLGFSTQQTAEFKDEIAKLQQEFRKVDMTAVAATAEEIAVKMDLPKNKISDLTRMTAVLSSTFVKEGRTQEDAVLAVGDALDGQFKRLQEIGITREKLMEDGWSGDLKDQAGLIDALNKELQDMGYEQTAKDITSLDEAFNALSVSGGNLLADILIPITPALIAIMDAAIGAIDGFKAFVGGMPEWAQIALGVTILALAFGILIPAMGGVGAVAGMIIGPLWGVAGAIMGISWPIVIVVAAIALLVIAIYEIGKAFGWWNDIGSMLEAIQAGLMRLWEAFVNHPDVQAFIQALTDAWNWLSSAVGDAWNAVLEFFGIADSGEFDVVAALIKGIGDAWTLLTAPIRTVIIYLEEMFGAFYRIATGQQDVQTAFAEAWQNIITRVWPIMNQLIQILGPVVQAFIDAAIRAGVGFVRNILVNIAMLPGRILTYLLAVNVRIIVAMARWIVTAAARARQFVLRILNVIRSLPGQFLALLLRVVSAIVSAGARWVHSAAAAARSVVTNVINRIRSLPGDVASALSGVVGAFTRPFQQAWDRIQPILDNIKNGIAQIAGAAGGDAAGGDIPMAAGGEPNPTELLNVATNEYLVEHDENITVDENITLTFDLKNVPSHIDERTLISMLNDKKVIKSIVENREFQRLDQKVKEKILAKTRRARGV